MPSLLSEFWNHRRTKQLTDIRNVGLYIFAIIVLAITWSGVKTVQNNYALQKKISTLQQQNDVLKLQNGNVALQNQYLGTDQYLDLAARQALGLAAPGERVLIIPTTMAMKYVDTSLNPQNSTSNTASANHQSKYMQNLEDWRDFLLGRKIFQD
jgi:cell division protein FtsB